MPQRTPHRRRYRILVWTDGAGNPEQVAIARYLDEERQSETTWTPEPFQSLAEVVAVTHEMLDIQLSLW